MTGWAGEMDLWAVWRKVWGKPGTEPQAWDKSKAWRWLREVCLLDEQRCSLCLTPFVAEASAPSCAVPSCAAPFCADCLADLRRRPPGRCPRCGLAMPAAGEVPCGRCLQYPPPWEHFVSVGPYSHSLRELLIRAKFRADTAALHGLGTLLALAVQREMETREAAIRAIVPMPLHPARLRERGFNQCVELARPVSRLLGVPVRNDLLTRQVDTPHQRGLTAVERRRNLRGAFVPGNVAGMRLLLLDDVMTTGTTLRLAAKTLTDAGAVVHVATAARA